MSLTWVFCSHSLSLSLKSVIMSSGEDEKKRKQIKERRKGGEGGRTTSAGLLASVGPHHPASFSLPCWHAKASVM